MQRGGRGRDDFFGFSDPFAGFGGFGRPGGLMSTFFDGRDPFDDPFFTQPFGSMLGPSMFGPSMFGHLGSPFGQPQNTGFLEDQPPQMNKSKGPVIQELSSDDEGGETDATTTNGGNHGDTIKHTRSGKEPYVEDPDEEMEVNGTQQSQYRNVYNGGRSAQPHQNACTFHSSTVTYGGLNGAYYTSSTTRRTGGEGVIVEESKEADATTGKASHRISRGIQDKGHSFTRKLNSDGRVDTLQTLHNLNEDELAGFEEAWKGNAGQHLPGWNQDVDLPNSGTSRGEGGKCGREGRGWALPPPAWQRQDRNPSGTGARDNAWRNPFRRA